jgi:hypothetical protein
MTDNTDMMYDRFLVEFEAYLQARCKLKRSRLQPLVWFERGFIRLLKAFLAVADSFAKAIIR